MKSHDEKLTLKLKQSSISGAKTYAKARGLSLSRMVEDYFEGVASPAPMDYIETAPAVRELNGVLKLPGKARPEGAYGKHLERKYGL